MLTLDEIHAAIERLTEPSMLALLLAAAAGALLVATPSVLAGIPMIVGYVAAEPGISRRTALTRSLAFVLGSATTFGSYGLVFGWAGTVLAPLFGPNGYLLAGVLLIVLGTATLGRVRFRVPWAALLERRVRSHWGAFVLGLPFGLVGSACPCSMPVVLAMLLYAGSVGSAWFGALLLFVFATVRASPLVAVGVFTGLVKDLSPLARWRPLLERAAGGLLVAFGIVFVAVGVLG